MIQSLQRLLLSTSSTPVIDYTTLLNISDRLRLDSISALAQQDQRFSTAAPIQWIPLRLASSIAIPNFCPGALELQRGNVPVPNTWSCPPCGRTMLAWGPRNSKGSAEPPIPPSWATGCKGMHWTFSFAQHGAILPEDRRKNGPITILRQCIICWDKLGIVSRKMTKEEWLAHVNEHLTSGGFQLCLNTNGVQIRRSACEVQSCQKIHTRG
jgi:hypothetical protein